MSDPFGRQLQPVRLEITGGEDIDQKHWADRIRGHLDRVHSVVTQRHREPNKEVIMIYPDANND